VKFPTFATSLPRMPTFYSADHTELHYELRGSGPLLVCQPGGPARPASYLDSLGGLTEHRTLLLLDPRGVGASAPAPAYDFAALGADLEQLRRHLDVPSFALLGHSAGTWPALWHAAHHPGTVDALVLLTPSRRLIPPLPGEPGQRALAGRWFGDRPWFGDAIAGYDAEDEAAEAPLIYAGDTPEIRAHAGRAGDSGRAGEPAAGFWDAGLDPATLHAVTAPVRIIAGDRDIVTGPAAPGVMAGWFPHATVTWLPGAGHFPWLTNADELVTALRT
jgi:proline iminopeptidase